MKHVLYVLAYFLIGIILAKITKFLGIEDSFTLGAIVLFWPFVGFIALLAVLTVLGFELGELIGGLI